MGVILDSEVCSPMVAGINLKGRGPREKLGLPRAGGCRWQ